MDGQQLEPSLMWPRRLLLAQLNDQYSGKESKLCASLDS